MTYNSIAGQMATADISLLTASKEVVHFGAGSMAIVAGAGAGLIKAAAVALREMQAEPDSFIGQVQSTTLKGNFNRGMNASYDWAHSTTVKKEPLPTGLDS